MRGRENEKRASEFERQGQKKFEKISKNPLTSFQKYVIIKMSKGKNKAKIQSVRLEKILGKAEKKS